MEDELELWQFIERTLSSGRPVILLVVADSIGSSPGRQGFKMAVSDEQFLGSIGGGIMEVNLVNQTLGHLRTASTMENIIEREKCPNRLTRLVHKKNTTNASGMICSGEQTIILSEIGMSDIIFVRKLVESLKSGKPSWLSITPQSISLIDRVDSKSGFSFRRMNEQDFAYYEQIGQKNDLYIIGGGHCSLALSELASKLGFHITVFDDRPDLNTIEKNQFAHEINIVESYENIGPHVPSGPNVYVVVMTIGYATDEIVIRALADKNFRYIGVLGSIAKMKVLKTTLKNDGVPAGFISRIRTPVGLPINSHSPEEIAVSIAAELISVKNA